MKIFQKIRSAVAGAAAGFVGSFGAFRDVTSFSPDRGTVMVLMGGDTRQYADRWTRKQILGKVEWLFQTFGIFKEGVRGIARHSVGKGVFLQLNSSDEEWNEIAEADFESYALSADRFDLAGRRNFYEMQFHAVIQRIKTGEFFAALRDNKRWKEAPCVQLWDAAEVETPSGMEQNDYVVDGVKLDADHNPVSYFVRKLGGGHGEIPAEVMVHWFFADATNQVRGVSELAQAVNPMIDARELINLTTKTAKQNSTIGLHIKKALKQAGQGAFGAIKRQALGSSESAPAGTGDQTLPAYEKLVSGGAIIYTDESGDAKFLTPQSPTPLMEPFISKVLMRNAFSAYGVPEEFFWSCTDLNGTNQRFILVKAETFFDWITDGLIGRFCTPVAARYLLHRIETGKLRAPRDPDWLTKIDWQRPARITVDNGRDAKVEIEQLSNGIDTLQGINDRRARNWRRATEQWFREFAFAEKCARKFGVEWALSKWRAGAPGAGSNNAEPTDEPEEKPTAQKE